MKRPTRFLAALLPLGFIFSCEKPQPTEDPVNDAPVSIVASPESINAAQEGGTYSLRIVSPSRPKVAKIVDWLSVPDGTYDKSIYTIDYSVTVSRNNGAERTADITITAGDLTATVKVSQEGYTVPEVDKSKISRTPVNPNANAAARKLYTMLWDNYGVKTLSGVQSSHSHTNDVVNAVAAATGRHPALAGYDFIFLQFSPTPAGWSWVRDYTDISSQVEQWKNGGVVCYMWHWNAPKDEETFRKNITSDGSYAFYCPGSGNGGSETNFDIREALKENTWQHEFILKDIDEVAVTLKKLQKEGVPVLFRPLHEAAGNYTRYNPAGGAWFWWGRYGARYCKELWNLLQDRLVKNHGLDNIIWVWTVDVVQGFEKEAAEWYPGDDRVDIVGFDVYANDKGAKPDQFAFLQNVTKGRKILAVSECGNIPSPEENILAGYPWSWFMVWPTAKNDVIDISGYPLNTAAYWKELMNSPFVITREDKPTRN